ncbi:MAG: DJ-1/PfpI family protein [Planctomycetaceae bacterium]
MNTSSTRPSSLQGGASSTEQQRPKVLLVIGDGAEVMDTLFPFYRLGEDFNVVVAGQERKVYHLVIHELAPGWDITEERLGYHLEPDAMFRDVDPAEFAGLVLPGGRAPEYLRYDEDLLRITRHFFETHKPVASICHGIEILATAGVLSGRTVTTIPKCRFDAEVCGATFVTDPVVRDGHLICCRGKKDMSPWMKEFVIMLGRENR